MATGCLDAEELRRSLGIYDKTAESPYVRRYERELARTSFGSIRRARALDVAAGADVLLVGEYHPLDSAARSCVEFLEDWARRGWKCLLGLEFVFARDQPALDAYLSGSIGQREFRRRIRFEEEWGYSWPALCKLLMVAKGCGARVRALDIPPRGGSADLRLRDRIAAERIACLLEERKGERALVLFGEAHLASAHLPRELLHRLKPGSRIVRILHDPEREDLAASGWYLADADLLLRQAHAPGARLRALASVYRSWAEDIIEKGEIDLPLAVHGVIDAEAAALGIDPRRYRIGPGRWLADLKPEVYGPMEEARALRRLRESGRTPASAREFRDRAAKRGALYLHRDGVFLVGRKGVRPLALESGRFLALALRPELDCPGFWSRLAVEALAFALAMVVDPALEEEPGWERMLLGADESASAADERRKVRVFGSWLGRLLALGLRQGCIGKAVFRKWLRAPLDGSDAALRLLHAMTSAAESKTGSIGREPTQGHEPLSGHE